MQAKPAGSEYSNEEFARTGSGNVVRKRKRRVSVAKHGTHIFSSNRTCVDFENMSVQIYSKYNFEIFVKFSIKNLPERFFKVLRFSRLKLCLGIILTYLEYTVVV